MTLSLNDNSASKLNGILKMTQDLVRTLRAQREMLKLRGIDKVVSEDPIGQLDLAAFELQRVAGRLQSEQIEVAQLRALARTTELINSTLDLDLVLNDVIDTAILLTGAERGYIILKNEFTGDLEFRVARNAQRRSLTPDEVIVSHFVINAVAETRELLVTHDASGDDRFSTSESVIDLVLRSILCVPLLVKGRLTGMVYADNRLQTALFGKREQELVQAFANQAAIAIENARLFNSVQTSLAEITAAQNLIDNVFASIASGVITTDEQELIQTINATAQRVLGLPEENLVGRSLWDVMPHLFDGFEAAVRRAQEIRSAETYEVEAQIDGRGIVNLTILITPLKGEARGVSIVLNDVTELIQRNQQISKVKLYLTPEMVDNIHDFSDETLVGQEREISILSCDIRDFTTFSENLEPEELMQVVNQYLTVSSDAVTLREGIVDKFIGDAVIGLYNTQLNPQPDHALRAVQSALLMVHDVEALHELLPAKYRLRYGIGVHTGPAIIGNVGSSTRKEFTAIGDSVQYAKFLQENALGGQVLVSAQTYALVGEHYTAEAIQPHRALSYYSGEPIYRIIGRRRPG
jgi:PAS domain S-box-containing protein